MAKRKKAATTPEPPTAEETIHAKHVFTPDELLEVGKLLGRTVTSITVLQQEKSAVTKDFSSRIETEEIRRDSLVDKVGSGYEMRETPCIVVFDPKNRSKDYFRKEGDDRGEFVERREMTTADFQLALPHVEDALVTPSGGKFD